MNYILSKLITWTLDIKIAFADTQTNTGAGQTLPNPLGEGATISSFLEKLINNLILIAIPIATIMILYGAFQILTAHGDPKEYDKGKQTIIYAVIGLVVIFLASGIPYLVKDILGAN